MLSHWHHNLNQNFTGLFAINCLIPDLAQDFTIPSSALTLTFDVVYHNTTSWILMTLFLVLSIDEYHPYNRLSSGSYKFIFFVKSRNAAFVTTAFNML